MIVPSKIVTAHLYEDFRANMIEDKSNLRPTDNDVLLIVGDGRCVWDDLEKWWEFDTPHDVMCVNEVAKAYPCDFQHFAAGDSHMNDMQAIAKSLSASVIKHAYNPTSRCFDVRWLRVYGGWSGTSGMFAVKVGLSLDYLRIVLAGCPMDNSGHWYNDSIPNNDPRQKSKHIGHLWKWVEFASRPISTFVRSLSGNTARVLGEPTSDWLEDIKKMG